MRITSAPDGLPINVRTEGGDRLFAVPPCRQLAILAFLSHQRKRSIRSSKLSLEFSP
ncbi:hypothetical protein M8494_13730 [Serratia ureilytica]